MASWVPIHRETAERLREFRHRQADLVQVLKEMRDAGLKAGAIEDEDANGRRFDLREIDPFTFLGNFNRGVTDENRTAMWSFLKNRWQLEAALPQDYDGLPLLNNQSAWLMPFAKRREARHVEQLWDAFVAVMNAGLDGEGVSEAMLDDCLSLRKVGLGTLTMGFFWCRPETWPALDRKNLALARAKGVTRAPDDGASYIAWAHEVRRVADNDLIAFSHQAHLLAQPRERGAIIHPPSAPAGHAAGDSEGRPVWLIAPGEGARLLPQWRQRSHMTMGWGNIGDLSRFIDVDELRDELVEREPEAGKTPVGSMLYEFGHEVQEGDEVFLKGGLFRILGRGIVRGPYEFVEGAPDRHCHQREVEWLDEREMDVPEGVTLPQVTLSHLEEKPRLLQALRDFYGSAGSNGLRPIEASEPLEGGTNYWWFNFNPDVWNVENRIDVEGMTVEEVKIYTAVNERGRKRQKSQWFAAARPGDLAIAYVTSPKRFAVAVCRVTRGLAETGGAGVGFAIVEKLRRPVLLDEMRAHAGLKSSEPLNSTPASILKLTKEQFEAVMELAETDGEAADSTGVTPYDLEMALKDLFMPREKLESLRATLLRKKNIILQGAPGTGKTFVARRLAYLLMGMRDDARAPMVQFHQSMSYEDFVQGYRPDGSGGFVLRDGLFYRLCRQAMTRPGQPHVLIIDEINRGNLSKILGELLMLIETDKRSPAHALPLTYASSAGDSFYVPENVFLIGTMNTADRSLSMVDYALRRRFAFVDMEPGFAHPAFLSLLQARQVPQAIGERIIAGMLRVNELVAEDTSSLGGGYRIGHSFFVPSSNVADADAWLADILTHEVLPLLQEYWMDDAKKLGEARRALAIPT